MIGEISIPATGGEIFGVRIGLDPHRPGLDRVCLLDFERPVWIIVGYLQAGDGDVGETAIALSLPREAVMAAEAYYAAHPRSIDALLLAYDSCCIE